MHAALRIAREQCVDRTLARRDQCEVVVASNAFQLVHVYGAVHQRAAATLELLRPARELGALVDGLTGAVAQLALHRHHDLAAGIAEIDQHALADGRGVFPEI
ncbi:hypothetical protein SDC9_200032 [bioreactor metagenome]|uniref:Uncharacterized protein n=1 Tax=bioreactor metagenome TaxID=1076179 RepID=A0A645IM46_9ZZZZ